MPTSDPSNTVMHTLQTGVFLDLDTLHPADLSLSPLTSTLTNWHLYETTLPGDIANRLQKAEVVVSNKVRIDEQVLSQAGQLQLICVAATGVNNIDMPACRQRKITVCNAQAYGTASVAQHTWALILALANQVAANHHNATSGAWSSADQFCLLDNPIMQLQGKILGIVGYGTLGQAVAQIAKAFGMRILIAKRDKIDQRSDRVMLEELLLHSDVVSLHCPLTEQNRNFIGQKELTKMKSSALLINTARGGLVDEQALADALCHGKLAGAATDVLSSEPPSPSNPLLQRVPNLIVTPHMAWSSQAARQTILEQTAENILAFVKGKPIRVVT